MVVIVRVPATPPVAKLPAPACAKPPGAVTSPARVSTLLALVMLTAPPMPAVPPLKVKPFVSLNVRFCTLCVASKATMLLKSLPPLLKVMLFVVAPASNVVVPVTLIAPFCVIAPTDARLMLLATTPPPSTKVPPLVMVKLFALKFCDAPLASVIVPKPADTRVTLPKRPVLSASTSMVPTGRLAPLPVMTTLSAVVP